MSIASEITRLQGAKASAKAAIESKGVSVPSSALVDSYYSYITAIPDVVSGEIVAVNIPLDDTGTVTIYNNTAGSTIAMESFSTSCSFGLIIPCGISYTVSITGSRNYLTPSVTYTSQAGNTRMINFNSFPLGIYFWYSDNSYSAYSDFESEKTLAGIGLVTTKVQLLVHPGLEPNAAWSNSTTILSGVPVISDMTSAASNFSGKTNTDALMAFTSSTTPAAHSARASIFTNGAIGYLPAPGEALEIHNNITRINSALKTAGKSAISVGNWLTSVQKNESYAWSTTSNGGLQQTHKNSSYLVLPVAELF